jgi:hypothetical protein
LCAVVPVFFMTNLTVPEGTVDGDSVKPNSNIDTWTVAPAPGFVGGVVVVVGGGAVVVVGAGVVVGRGAAAPTRRTPFIPAAA